MTQGMAEQQELLTWLVKDAYGGHGAVLHALSPHLLEDRGNCPALLRAGNVSRRPLIFN